MNRTRTLFTVFALVVAVNSFAATTKLTDLVKSPEKFDGKVITTSGTVAKFQAKTSKIGNKYFIFEVKSGEAKISLYGRGELAKAPKDGQKVEVTGKFEKEHKMRDFSVKNQLTVAGDKDIKILVK